MLTIERILEAIRTGNYNIVIVRNCDCAAEEIKDGVFIADVECYGMYTDVYINGEFLCMYDGRNFLDHNIKYEDILIMRDNTEFMCRITPPKAYHTQDEIDGIIRNAPKYEVK